LRPLGRELPRTGKGDIAGVEPRYSVVSGAVEGNDIASSVSPARAVEAKQTIKWQIEDCWAVEDDGLVLRMRIGFCLGVFLLISFAPSPSMAAAP
jgi:hypothetical protein